VSLSQNYPNPFNPSTRVRLCADGGPVRLSVYDVAGARIRVLVDAAGLSGSREVVWDGRDGAGRDVSSGVYFLRLEIPGRSITRKAVLLR
jgi:hypothetical protein